MGGVTGLTNAQKSKCPRCGELKHNFLESTLCCLLAPPAQGWCAWCGEDVEGKQRVFCDSACAREYVFNT